MIGMASLISSAEMLNDCVLKVHMCISCESQGLIFCPVTAPGEYLSIWNMISPVEYFDTYLLQGL